MLIKFIQSLPDHLKYLIILVGVVLLFIFALLPNSFLWIALKIVLFLALLSFLLFIYQDSFEEAEEEARALRLEGGRNVQIYHLVMSAIDDSYESEKGN